MVFGLFKSGPNRKDVANATPFGQLPNFQKNAFQEYIQRGQDVGLNQPELFSTIGYSPEQLGAIGALRSGVDAPGMGDFRFGQRASGAYDQANTLMNRFDPTLSTALSSIQSAQDPITGEQLQSGIADFMNPYTGQVIDAGIQDLTESTDKRRSAMEGRASGNLGAFGGSRMGVESAELQRGLNREIGTLGGNLRAEGFRTASQQALQRLTDERNRALAGGQAGLGALGQITQGANTMTGIGDSLFRSRMGMEQMRGDVRDRNVARLQEMIGAGDILRDYQRDVQQEPLSQLNYLGQIATANPGVGAGALPNRKSIAEGFQSLTQGISNLVPKPPAPTPGG